MSAAPDEHSGSLDGQTCAEVLAAVEAAKRRGWAQVDLARWFADRGVTLQAYKTAVAGGAASEALHGLLAQISVIGLPPLPYDPSAEHIRAHLDWLTSPARGEYDDALVEVAFGKPDLGVKRSGFFGLDELEEATAFAIEQNLAGHNVYIGAALRMPDTDRSKRATAEDFYLATAVPIDIDADYDAVRARMAAACDDGLVVTTGLTPERRSQHWVRLVEPCDDGAVFGAAFASLVHHTGADLKVKDVARLMRLGGTVSIPDQAKRAKGYAIELTSVALMSNAKPSSVEALAALAPGEAGAAGVSRDFSSRPHNSGIVRDWTGRVTNGREAHWRNEVLKAMRRFQSAYGGDPTCEDIWDEVWADFSDPRKVDNQDQRWTSADGQMQLRQRLKNTLRRLRIGRLARSGLYSIETGAGREQAEAAEAAWQATQQAAPEASAEEVQADASAADSEADAEEPSEPPPPGDYRELPAHLIACPGLVGEIAAFIVATARHPQPTLALGAALCMVGTAAGRRYAGPTRSGTHLYVLSLAKTGAGKNHAAKMGARILEAAKMGEHIGPTQYMSMSAVFHDLADQPLKLAFVDEFGGYMARITTTKGSPHERAVKDILRTAWGCSFETLRPLAYADKNRALDPINAPALSIYGMSTPEEFYAALQGTDVFNGFLNRWLVLPTEQKPSEVDPELDEFDVPVRLIDGLTRIICAVAPAKVAAPETRLDWETAEARLFYREFRRSIEAREEHGAMLSRVAEMAVRLATIRAIGRSILPAVSLADIRWGAELALWSAERMIRDAERFMVESEHQGRAKLVLRLLRDAPKRRLSRQELTRKLQHQFDARTLDIVIQGLADAEQVEVLTVPAEGGKAGRRGLMYVLTDGPIPSQAAA